MSEPVLDYCVTWNQDTMSGLCKPMLVQTNDGETAKMLWERFCKDKVSVSNVVVTLQGKVFDPADDWPSFPFLPYKQEPTQDGWWVPHPGTLAWIRTATFEEALDKWFEGFNLPRLVTGGQMEPLAKANERVCLHFSGTAVGKLFYGKKENCDYE